MLLLTLLHNLSILVNIMVLSKTIMETLLSQKILIPCLFCKVKVPAETFSKLGRAGNLFVFFFQGHWQKSFFLLLNWNSFLCFWFRKPKNKENNFRKKRRNWKTRPIHSRDFSVFTLNKYFSMKASWTTTLIWKLLFFLVFFEASSVESFPSQCRERWNFW